MRCVELLPIGTLAVCAVLVMVACSRGGGESSVLAPGERLPPEITSLRSDTSNGQVRIFGTFERDGRVVRFQTLRGPRTPFQEFQAGWHPYEVDACFTNAEGRPLVGVAGGHEIMIPGCGSREAEAMPEDSETSGADMDLAWAAMETLEKLRFKSEFRPEHEALTGTLHLFGRTNAIPDLPSDGSNIDLGEDEGERAPGSVPRINP